VDRARLPAPEGSQQHLDTEFVQPRNELEKTLVEMWQRIIRVDQIGVNDNFFELGGDSIRGAVFINQLEKILGQSIYVAALFEAQTISELANYLISNYPVAVVERLSTGSEAVFDLQSATFENGKAPIPQSVHPSMVPIQPQGSKYPLFCVHSAGGVVFPYYNLVPYLGNDQPLYGVQDPSYVQMDKSFSSLEDIAAYYVDGLQKVQPSGPYHIAGWSSGGVMAFEMAQQLSRQGEKVAFLGIIDFRAPGQFVPSKRQPRLEGKGYFEFGHFHMVLKTLRVLPKMVKEFLILLKSALSYTWDGLYLKYRTPNQDKTAEKPTLKEYLKWFWISAWRSSFLEKSELAKSLPRDSNLLLIELPTVRHVLGRVGEDIRLTRKYVPEVYDGKITVLSAGSFEADNQDPKNTTMGWDQLTEGEVEVRKIPGNHMAVLHKPYVESFAQIIKDCLDQASKE
jgi:thioesterase domain-containing protein